MHVWKDRVKQRFQKRQYDYDSFILCSIIVRGTTKHLLVTLYMRKSTLLLILIFITLKRNIKSAPALKHRSDSENYSVPNDSDTKKSNKIAEDEDRLHHNHHRIKPSSKKSHSKRNLTSDVNTHVPLSENLAIQSKNSIFSKGKLDEIINTINTKDSSKTVTSDKIGRQFLNDLLLLLFIGTVCLTLVVLSSWLFYNQARKFRKHHPDIENQVPEPTEKDPGTPKKISDTYFKISKILRRTNSNHEQHLLEELVDILRRNVEIPPLKEEIDSDQNTDESLSKNDLQKIEKLTTVKCSSEEEKKCASPSIPDLPHYLIERKNKPFPIETQERLTNEFNEMVSPSEHRLSRYQTVMDNYRNDVVTPTLHFIGQDVSTSTEDLQSPDIWESIGKPLSDYKTGQQPDKRLDEREVRKIELDEREDFEKPYFFRNQIKKDDSRVSVSVQTVGPNDDSFVRKVKFSGEVKVKYYLVNQPIHAFDKRKRRSRTFEIREVVETFPTKRRDGLGKCKTMKQPVKSRGWVESKPCLRCIHHLCSCCHED